MYTEKDLIRIAKRENNAKRPYLLVNPLQGKHIPCSPAKALDLFRLLAEKLTAQFPDERLLLIGFAETATAIGAGTAACCSNASYFIQTTREAISGAEYLYFSEAHSHATEQRLVKNQLRRMLRQTDRVVFVEDEITTGNTILNAVNAMETAFKDERAEGTPRFKYAVISILNNMAADAYEAFARRDIPYLYLLRLQRDPAQYQQRLESYDYCSALRRTFRDNCLSADVCTEELTGWMDPRNGVDARAYVDACRLLAQQIVSRFTASAQSTGGTLLVLGAEEFMFPALLSAAALENTGLYTDVRFHATTRSPILPASGNAYPLTSRWQLRSLYDENRETYIYNLQPYDRVILLLEPASAAQPGLGDLITALRKTGCKDISVCRWTAQSK